MRKNKGYEEALKGFNRSAGQLKRWHNIDPAKYLDEESKTKKGVERALARMKLDAELEDIEEDIDDLAEAYDEAEEAAKEADFEEHVNQYEQARETLSKNYGIDMDDTESEIFWRAFDDPDILDAFGSTNVLYMGEEARDDDSVTTRQAAEIAKGTAAQSIGSGKTAEDIRNDYNTYFKAYKYVRSKDKLGHSAAIDEIFSHTPDELEKMYFKKK